MVRHRLSSAAEQSFRHIWQSVGSNLRDQGAVALGGEAAPSLAPRAGFLLEDRQGALDDVEVAPVVNARCGHGVPPISAPLRPALRGSIGSSSCHHIGHRRFWGRPDCVSSRGNPSGRTAHSICCFSTHNCAVTEPTICAVDNRDEQHRALTPRGVRCRHGRSGRPGCRARPDGGPPDGPCTHPIGDTGHRPAPGHTPRWRAQAPGPNPRRQWRRPGATPAGSRAEGRSCTGPGGGPV